jgi:RNA polymerase sigma-70 factor (ECF subfamily)
VALLGDHTDARDAFAQASEDLWRGIARFERRSSLRTWYYILARNAASRLRRSPHHRYGRHTPISQISDLVDCVRSTTARYLRTDLKNGFTAIREALDPDDRSLLVLRVDRNLSWSDIARIMAPDDETDTDAKRVRVAARLRKRFQLIKDEIRRRARVEGLVPEDAGQ